MRLPQSRPGRINWSARRRNPRLNDEPGAWTGPARRLRGPVRLIRSAAPLAWGSLLVAAALTASGAAQQSGAPAGDAQAGAAEALGAFRVPPTEASRVSARIHFLPDGQDAALAAPPTDARQVVVTGAYTRADKFEPGGLVIRAGDATTRFPQRWDGVLLVSADGEPSLHNKRAVWWRGRRFNLDADDERVAFLDAAQSDRLSALQSHLLISEGRLDLREIEGAPRFRRRLLFDTSDGRIGVYESETALTLYEAAVDLMRLAEPRMALNLDMGAYNFCEERAGSETTKCGVVSRAGLDRLTNLIELRVAP